MARTVGLVDWPNVVHWAASRPGRTFRGQGADERAGPGLPRAGWRGSEPLRTTEQHHAPFRPHPQGIGCLLSLRPAMPVSAT